MENDSASNSSHTASTYYQRKPEDYTTTEKAWEATKTGAKIAWKWADAAGEKIADFLGITQSRFQYAIDEMERIERRKQQQEKRKAEHAHQYKTEACVATNYQPQTKTDAFTDLAENTQNPGAVV
eukprot:TRINITY_DN85642_c0_g1_i1.p1 TRINITY_DN85642_c0_g1~~TRINITY_DN85642_c0_g1_i1.p1  ORF type:complete len:125 (-),score=7.10 TRINITY_DN85642_c0_g1_i1:69-443(-)